MPNSMETFAARLASFDALLPATKKRASDTKGARKLKWPHSDPSPSRLAYAGFWYNPTSSCPDNVTCYLCSSNLDGWEATDDPVDEHMAFGKNCGWAVVVSVEKAVEQQAAQSQNPLDEYMLEARRMTFATGWPHENKRGWLCKIEQLIYAGWHYAPTPESDDSVKCSYCSLSLDGWEPKDKPFEEHHRRSPDCLFFQMADSTKTKPAPRSKKDRTSRASRMSTQSTFTIASEAPSMEDLESDRDSILSTATTKSRTKKGGKKATKTRSKATKKKAAVKLDEPIINSSFIEPEDDDFSVKVDRSPELPKRGKKRQSQQISQDGPLDEGNKDPVVESRPTKRRTANTRSSALPTQDVYKTLQSQEEDVPMPDVADQAVPQNKARKTAKAGKKSSTTRARKASVQSTASKASMRAGLSDGDDGFGSDLDLDLEKPLSDDEEEAHAEPSRKSTARRHTRNKVSTKSSSASKAPTRRVTRASTVPTETPAFGASIAATYDNQIENHSEAHVPDSSVVDDDAAELAPKKGRKARPKKAVPQEQSTGQEVAQTDLAEPEQETLSDQVVKQPVKRQPGKRQVSRQKAPKAAETSQSDQEPEPISPKADTVQATLVENERSIELEPVEEMKPKEKKTGPKRKGQSNKRAEAIDSTAKVDETPEAIDEDQQDTKHASPGVETRHSLENRPVEEDASSEIAAKTTKGAKAKVTGNKKKAGKQKTKAKAAAQDVPASPPVTKTMTPAASPQSSDAENQPPSSRPSAVIPQGSFDAAPLLQAPRFPLTDRTPVRSPSKHTFSKLQTNMPWTAVDLELVFQNSPTVDKGNALPRLGENDKKLTLTSPDRQLSVEQWIQQNAKQGEERLRTECERLVSIFEDQGNRALRTLEGIVCVE